MSGSQFYLFWDANYNDARIICVPDEVEEIFKEIGGGSRYTILLAASHRIL
jgi:hypothetical protein